jgi:hypothetical protein
MVTSNSTTNTLTIFLEGERTQKLSDISNVHANENSHQTSIFDACGMRNKEVHMASKSFSKELYENAS